MNATRYDLVLGGIVRVRLQGASPRVAAALAMQLGTPAPERAGDAAPRPDIEVTVAEPGRPMPVDGAVDDDASPLRVVIADVAPGRPIPQLRS
ncbi:MAG TPA: hypothetical protein VKB30_07640, partial [Candidatus Limnocylindrales bacterium]|nr:hypothetical protein [Candidatus Limnocylindrales bacterium]